MELTSGEIIAGFVSVIGCVGFLFQLLWTRVTDEASASKTAWEECEARDRATQVRVLELTEKVGYVRGADDTAKKFLEAAERIEQAADQAIRSMEGTGKGPGSEK